MGRGLLVVEICDVQGASGKRSTRIESANPIYPELFINFKRHFKSIDAGMHPKGCAATGVSAAAATPHSRQGESTFVD